MDGNPIQDGWKEGWIEIQSYPNQSNPNHASPPNPRWMDGRMDRKPIQDGWINIQSKMDGWEDG